MNMGSQIEGLQKTIWSKLNKKRNCLKESVKSVVSSVLSHLRYPVYEYAV